MVARENVANILSVKSRYMKLKRHVVSDIKSEIERHRRRNIDCINRGLKQAVKTCVQI